MNLVFFIKSILDLIIRKPLSIFVEMAMWGYSFKYKFYEIQI